MAQDRPVHEVRLGKVKAAIWRNETENGVRYGVTFSRIYKTDNGWESSLSFGRDELPLVGKVSDLAHTEWSATARSPAIASELAVASARTNWWPTLSALGYRKNSRCRRPRANIFRPVLRLRMSCSCELASVVIEVIHFDLLLSQGTERRIRLKATLQQIVVFPFRLAI